MKTLLKTNLFLSCLTVLLCFGITALSYGQAVVSVDPAESPSPGVGSQLTISLKITSGRNVAAYEVGVNFDTSALRYVSSTNGSYLPTQVRFSRRPKSLAAKSRLQRHLCRVLRAPAVAHSPA